MTKSNTTIKAKNSLPMAVVMGAITIMLSACGSSDPLSPGIEYMPDMYRGMSYETYGEGPGFKDSVAAQGPVAGTVSQGQYANTPLSINEIPYPYPNTIEGYAQAASLKNPLEKTAVNVVSGKNLYTKMCIHCHGAAGDGKGTLMVAGDPFPVPSYYDAAHLAVTEGQMFHSIHYGKNMMGSHASQLNKEERWKIVMYVQELQRAGAPGVASAAPADTTAKAKS